jgi:hypothetical protein
MFWFRGPRRLKRRSAYKMNPKLLFTAILVTLIGTQVPSYSDEEKGVYTNPDQLRGVPTNIVIELKRLNCLIPQGILDHTNAIEGEFALKGQKDWAVLCSTNEKSHIHIFWGGPNKCPSAFAERSDKYYFYKQSNGDWEYYRGLGKVGKKFIVEHYKAYGGPKPPPITHDAIDDRWLEKGSVVHYCHQGEWVELTGAD